MKVLFSSFTVFVTCFMLLVSTASTTLDIQVEVICPICSTRFPDYMRLSEFRTGTRLDLKPLGPNPGPPPLPVCPSCHFVVYEEELSETEKQILVEYVRSEGYQKLAEDWPSYYLLAKLLEQIKKDGPSISRAYLKASWQVEDNPDRCRHCLEKSLEHLDRYLIYPGTLNEEWPTLQLLAGELERRLGEFVRAKNRFLLLSCMPQFQGNLLERIINFQLKLIEAKDTRPHDVSEIEQDNP